MGGVRCVEIKKNVLRYICGSHHLPNQDRGKDDTDIPPYQIHLLQGHQLSAFTSCDVAQSVAGFYNNAHCMTLNIHTLTLMAD